MRILITGVSGMLGSHLYEVLNDSGYEVFGTFHNNKPIPRILNSVYLDLTSTNCIEHVLEVVAPDCVIHSAALTDVDRCESDPNLAHQINGFSTEILAKKCELANIKIVYVSTDYIFDGGGLIAANECIGAKRG